MSSIKKLNKSGPKAASYKACFTLGSGARRVRRSKLVKTKREAQSWLAEQSLKYPNMNTVWRRSLRFEDYYKLWFKMERANVVEPATADTYSVTLSHLKPFFKKGIGQITNMQVQSVFNALGKTLSHATLLKDLSHLRMMCRAAIRKGDLSYNPCEDIDLGGNNARIKPYEKKFMAVSDLRIIQDFLLKYSYEFTDINRLVIFICTQTAMRCGEALALRVDDIDCKARTIRVDQSYDSAHSRLKVPKTPTSNRLIPISSECANVLDGWIVQHQKWLQDAKISNSKGLIFLNKRGQLPTAKNINSSFHQLQKRLDINPIYTVHSLRSTLASLMVEQGVPVTYVAKALGHAPGSNVTLKYYIDVLPSAVQADREQAVKVISSTGESGTSGRSS
ncbi:MAG TPA: site-specific integrase [Lactobacillus sp.]|nr:site-specific integrase [Lactobacillus sp.]